MPATRKYKRQEFGADETSAGGGTRERILDVAAGLFRGSGYENTSISDIGRAVGISGPAVYHHFAGKQRILFICCERASIEQIELGRRALQQPTPLEQLVAFVYGDCVYQLRSLESAKRYGSGAFTFRELINSLTEQDRERINSLRRTLFETPRAIVRAGVDDGSFEPVDPTATSFALFGMTQQTVAWFRLDGRLTVEELAVMYAYNAAKIVLPNAEAADLRKRLSGISLTAGHA
jgi:AcrR family transcriptional regulator